MILSEMDELFNVVGCSKVYDVLTTAIISMYNLNTLISIYNYYKTYEHQIGLGRYI